MAQETRARYRHICLLILTHSSGVLAPAKVSEALQWRPRIFLRQEWCGCHGLGFLAWLNGTSSATPLLSAEVTKIRAAT